MDPLSIARGGLMAASAQFEASAVRTAQMGPDSTVDPAQEAVQQISAKHQFSANLGVIRIADEMWRSLLAIQER
ncbi:MAG: hypothetical protein JWP50_2980 [Phenylobacterium sp.]|nr:hypothetical protein [Phenylobacterium sp.]